MVLRVNSFNKLFKRPCLFLWIYLVSSKILSLREKNSALGQIFIIVNDQILNT